MAPVYRCFLLMTEWMYSVLCVCICVRSPWKSTWRTACWSAPCKTCYAMTTTTTMAISASTSSTQLSVNIFLSFFSPLQKKCTVNLLKYVRIILTYSDISHLFVKKDGTKNMCKVRVTYLLLVHFRISQHHNSISLSTAVLRIKDFLEQINW